MAVNAHDGAPPKDVEGVWVSLIPANCKKKFFVRACSSNTVSHVKAQVENLEGILAGQQRLIFEGRELAVDSRTLSDAGILTSVPPTLHLIVQGQSSQDSSDNRLEFANGADRICVRTLSGTCESFLLEVSELDTIAATKCKVQEMLAVPQGQQRLIFAGKELSDNCTLCECGVRTTGGSVLYLLCQPSKKMGEPALLERELDGTWFQARVLRNPSGGNGFVDLQYLDDGNIETNVDPRSCRAVWEEPL